MSAISAIFGLFARTYPITLKLHQNIESVILIKIAKKIGNIYGHLAKIAIWNLKNYQNFKNNENFKSVRETWNFFIRWFSSLISNMSSESLSNGIFIKNHEKELAIFMAI